MTKKAFILIFFAYVALGLSFSLSSGLYFSNQYKLFVGYKDAETIAEVRYAEIRGDKDINICYETAEHGKLTAFFDIHELTSSTRSYLSNVFQYELNDRQISVGCDVGFGHPVNIYHESFVYGLKSNLYKALSLYSTTPELKVIQVTGLDPDANILGRSKDVVIFYKNMHYVLKFPLRSIAGDASAIFFLPFSVFKDILTYPYQIYKLIESGS